MVKNLLCNAGDVGLIPGGGTKTPRAVVQLEPMHQPAELPRWPLGLGPLSRLSPQGQGLQASPRPADTDSNSGSHILRAHGLRQQTKVAQTLLSACWYCSKQQQNQKGAEENVLGCLGEQSYVSISPCLLQHMKSWGTEIKSMNYFPKRQEW